MQGWWISTTTLIAFDNVRVPAKHIIGKLNGGFSSIMSNFNHERCGGQGGKQLIERHAEGR